MNLNVWELTMCLPSEAPREAAVMMVMHKLAFVGASCIGISLHQALCQPHQSFLQLLLFQSAGTSSFCLLFIDNASYKESCQTSLCCGSFTRGRHGKIIQLVLIKNSYSYICN